jgi:TetR/AcrR family transcriptional regulator, lmrAB and yxaGH operons repressor
VTSDSRERMVASAAALIGSRGVSATSFSEVLTDSGAPRGSIYHHFPDGKRQLATDAVTWTSDQVVAYVRAGAPRHPRDVLDRFVGMWRRVVLASDGAAGCVVAGVAVDTDASADGADADQELMALVHSTFRAWVDALAEQLAATGVPAKQARAIATTTLAAMEGALILCRAEASVGPLDAVAAELRRLLP